MPAADDLRSQLHFLGACCLCILGLLFGLAMFAPRMSSKHKNVDDFTGFLIGAKLLGANPYSVPANLQIQRELVGATNPGVIFIRPPFFALAIKPFLHLPYQTALSVWKLLMAACLVAFVGVAPYARSHLALALCWSIPAFGAVAVGNDSPFILLLLGVSLLCWRKGWRLAAGISLALCLAKFHFLIFLPLLLFRREYRHVLAGFASAAGVLLAVSFAVKPDWIPLYWRALNMPQPNLSAQPSLMPNLYASFFWTGHPAFAVTLGFVLIGAALWPICRNLPFDVAMPLCIFGATLASPHTNFLDGVLAIPAILTIATHFPRVRFIAWFLLSPVAGLLCFLGPQSLGPLIVVGASLALLCVARLNANGWCSISDYAPTNQ